VSTKQNVGLSPKKNATMSSKLSIAKGKRSMEVSGKKALALPKGYKLPWKFFYSAKPYAHLEIKEWLVVATWDLEKCNTYVDFTSMD